MRQFGVDPIKFVRAFKATPRFILSLIEYARKGGFRGNHSISAVLLDFHEDAGSSDGHYFWQDLLAAQWVNDMDANSILDVGSRIDGFVSHVAASREINLLDFRPLTRIIPNINFIQGDAMRPMTSHHLSYQIVTSLHAIEHFGLGRYGDPIDLNGHVKGLRNIAECVSVGGCLIVSFPIGVEITEFNAQRILHPKFPVENLPEYELEDFYLIPWKGQPERMGQLPELNEVKTGSAGLYKFRRIR